MYGEVALSPPPLLTAITPSPLCWGCRLPPRGRSRGLSSVPLVARDPPTLEPSDPRFSLLSQQRKANLSPHEAAVA